MLLELVSVGVEESLLQIGHETTESVQWSRSVIFSNSLYSCFSTPPSLCLDPRLKRPLLPPISHHPHHDVGEGSNPQSGADEGQHEPVLPAR